MLFLQTKIENLKVGFTLMPYSDVISNKTYSPKKEEALKQRKWYIIDAEGQTLGRLASNIARILKGKHKPIFSPHVDCGDFVVVINAEKIKVTGKKDEKKFYFSHSGYPGGEKFESFKDLLKRKPEFVLWHAVKLMLPKNRLARRIIRKLKIYAGPNHPHKAQKPEPIPEKLLLK